MATCGMMRDLVSVHWCSFNNKRRGLHVLEPIVNLGSCRVTIEDRVGEAKTGKKIVVHGCVQLFPSEKIKEIWSKWPEVVEHFKDKLDNNEMVCASRLGETTFSVGVCPFTKRLNLVPLERRDYLV